MQPGPTPAAVRIIPRKTHSFIGCPDASGDAITGGRFAQTASPRGVHREWSSFPTMSQDDPIHSADMSVDRGPARAYEAYNEEAFRHFMAIECKRAERSGRSLLLLLVELKADRDGQTGIPPAMASRLFAALTACVREIDFIGWYRAGRLIGAVLTQGTDPGPDISRQISERVAGLMGERLSGVLGRRLDVRVVQLHLRISN